MDLMTNIAVILSGGFITYKVIAYIMELVGYYTGRGMCRVKVNGEEKIFKRIKITHRKCTRFRLIKTVAGIIYLVLCVMYVYYEKMGMQYMVLYLAVLVLCWCHPKLKGKLRRNRQFMLVLGRIVRLGVQADKEEGEERREAVKNIKDIYNMADNVHTLEELNNRNIIWEKLGLQKEAV